MSFPQKSQVEEKAFNKSPQVQKNQKLSQNTINLRNASHFLGAERGLKGGSHEQVEEDANHGHEKRSGSKQHGQKRKKNNA